MNAFNNDTIARFDEQLEPQGFVAIYWHIEDVKGIRPDLSDAQALAVLKRAKDTEDAEYGLCLNLLSEIAEILFGPEHIPAEEGRPS